MTGLHLKCESFDLDVGAGNGSGLFSTKPMPELMLTKSTLFEVMVLSGIKLIPEQC